MAEYFLFLAKVLTILFAVLVVIVCSSTLGSRRKSDTQGKLKVLDYNQKMQLSATSLSHFGTKPPKAKKAAKNKRNLKPKLFVLDFKGDLKASAVARLREEINAIVLGSQEQDEVLVRIESPGGSVTGYGLAAAQLMRLKQHNIKLTCAVDQVAASGGYLMACVADALVAAPFAIVGSIGVVLQLPNFHRLLQKNQIDFEMLTAGQYKRTLTLFGENTEHGREKTQQDIETTHSHFKSFLKTQRPSVDLDQVATGEFWHAQDAISLGLVDELATSDEVLSRCLQSHQILLLSWSDKRSLMEKLKETRNSLLYALTQAPPR